MGEARAGLWEADHDAADAERIGNSTGQHWLIQRPMWLVNGRDPKPGCSPEHPMSFGEAVNFDHPSHLWQTRHLHLLTRRQAPSESIDVVS